MKKFMKGCAYTALVFFVIGFVLATAAGSVRGRTTIEDVVESVTGGRVHIDWGPFPWGINVRGGNGFLGWWDNGFLDDVLDDDFLEDIDHVDYIVEENIGFDRNHTILKGNVEKYSLGSDIRRLDFEVGACSFTTEPSADDNFYLKADYAGKLQGYVEGSTLYIRSTATVKKWNDLNGCRIVLYVPEGAYFDSADIEVGAGRLEFDRLYADDISLEVGAGQITLKNLQAGKLESSVGFGQLELKDSEVGTLDAEVGMGDFSADGVLGGDAKVECAMGNVSLKLEGSQRDYNYELSKALGSVTLGNTTSSGFASEKYIDNGADKTIEIECSMGNVSVRFTE